MTRLIVRTLKRAVRDGVCAGASDSERTLGRDSALALLARSVNMGHARLAVIRLGIAVDVGARVPQAHWSYCLQVATVSGDLKLQDIYRSAATRVCESTALGTI